MCDLLLEQGKEALAKDAQGAIGDLAVRTGPHHYVLVKESYSGSSTKGPIPERQALAY